MPGVRATDAAQFMPFAALTGFEELVSEREHSGEPRHEVTEERAEEVSCMLARLRRGDEVVVTHYGHDRYVETAGTVREVSEAFRRLELVGGEQILFKDIWAIRWRV